MCKKNLDIFYIKNSFKIFLKRVFKILWKGAYYKDPKYLSASKAAIQPDPAAVIAWR